MSKPIPRQLAKGVANPPETNLESHDEEVHHELDTTKSDDNVQEKRSPSDNISPRTSLTDSGDKEFEHGFDKGISSDPDLDLLKPSGSLIVNTSFFVTDDELPVKVVGPDDEEIEIDDIVVAPDRGWAWVIVLAAFCSNLIADGTAFSFGVLLKPIRNTPSTEANEEYEVTWVESTLIGFAASAGPFSSALTNRFGFRITAFIGSILSSFGFIMCWYFNQDDQVRPNFPALFMFYGVIGGIGLSMLYVTSVIAVGYYFEKRRALATGIAVSGAGLGTVIYAPLAEKLVMAKGWAFTILIQGCILLSCVFCAAAYRPLHSANEQKKAHQSDDQLPHLENVCSDDSGTLNVEVLKADQGQGIEGTNVEGITDPSHGIVPIPKSSSYDREQPELEANVSSLQIRQLTRFTPSTKGKPPVKLTLAARKSQFETNLIEARVLHVSNKNTLNKPLYRSNIFYGGDLGVLKDSERTLINLEGARATKSNQSGSCHGRFRFLRMILDFSLLKSATFSILCLEASLGFWGDIIPYTFIIELVHEKIGKDLEVAYLLAVIGAFNTIGRILTGFAADYVLAKVRVINDIALAIGGVVTILVTFFNIEAAYIVYSCVFGLTIGCTFSLKSIIVVELVGIHKLTNAFGLLILFEGFTAFIGTPLAGYLRKLTGTTTTCFYLAGSVMVVASLLGFPLHYAHKREMKRRTEKGLGHQI